MGQRGRPPLHTEEFRRDAVALVRSSDRTIAQVAEELGVNRETLRSWVRRLEKDEALASAGVGRDELEELKRLRRENAELKVEREILRKAAQYTSTPASPCDRTICATPA